MTASLVNLAQAVTDKLNTGGAFTPPLNAERTYQLFYELAEAKTPKVSVYASADTSPEKCDRSRWKHELTIDVAVQRKLDTDENAEKDALVELADRCCEYIKANRPDGPWKLMEAGVQPFSQNELLKQNKLFTAVARFLFIEHR